MNSHLHSLQFATALVSALTCLTAQADPALTIYNQGFAVVRDSVPLDLKAGVNSITYSGATAQVEPESVILRDASGKVPLQILEQSYRNDPADVNLLLRLFEGKTIDFEVRGENSKSSLIPGKIIRGQDDQTGLTPIIEMDGKLRFGLPGQPIFPSLGDNTILQPTFTWQLQSAAETKLNAELAYVTGGFSWNADYNLVLPEKGESIDMIGWVSVKNESGKSFQDAKLKLLAGDVQKVIPQRYDKLGRKEDRAMPMAAMAEAAPAVTEKSFDDYHLYSVARQVSLRDRETKQIEFSRAQGVNSTRFYVYDGSGFGAYGGMMPWYGEADYGGAEGSKKVASFVEFKNSEENKLGIPLPKGRVRFYRADGDQLQFIGEAEIDHTPKDETLRLQTGNAFDLVGERKRTNFTKHQMRDEATESFEIKVRNRKKEPVEIRVVEHLFRWMNWEILESTLPHTKLNAQRIEFRVPLQPDEEKVLTYTVRYRW
jgi:hypothetical protein